MMHESLYVRPAPLMVAVLIMLAMVIAGAMMGVVSPGAPNWPVRLIVAGVGVGIAGVLTLPLFISRRRWEIANGTLAIQRGPAILPRSFARRHDIAMADIARVSRSFLGAREIVIVTDATGTRHALAVPASAPVIDALLQDLAAAKGTPARLHEEAGFWASGGAIILVVIALTFSLVIAGVLLWALLDQSLHLRPGSGATKGMGIVLALPFLLLWALRAILRRRAQVRGVNEA